MPSNRKASRIRTQPTTGNLTRLPSQRKVHFVRRAKAIMNALLFRLWVVKSSLRLWLLAIPEEVRKADAEVDDCLLRRAFRDFEHPRELLPLQGVQTLAQHHL